MTTNLHVCMQQAQTIDSAEMHNVLGCKYRVSGKQHTMRDRLRVANVEIGSAEGSLGPP